MMIDIALMSCSFTISYLLSYWKFNLYISPELNILSIFFTLIFITILIHFLFNVYFGLYSSLIRYISFDDVKRVIISGTFGSIILILIFNFIDTFSSAIALMYFRSTHFYSSFINCQNIFKICLG